MLDSVLETDYGTQHSSVRSTVQWDGDGWRMKCAACPGLTVSTRDDQDDALWLAWSHHQDAHPRSVMKFQLL